MALIPEILGTWTWMHNNASAPATPTSGVNFYAEGGVAKVKQSDGTVIPIVASSGGKGFAYFMA